MEIKIKLYATLAELLPADAEDNTVVVDVDPDVTAHALIDRFNVPRPKAHLVLLNGVYIEPEQRDEPLFKAGDTLVIFPPVAGG